MCNFESRIITGVDEYGRSAGHLYLLRIAYPIWAGDYYFVPALTKHQYKVVDSLLCTDRHHDWVGGDRRPLSRHNFSQMASLRSGIPEVGVYLVKPSFMAFMAASAMLRGRSESGSPMPKPMTLMPSWAILFTLVLILMVPEGAIFSAILDKVISLLRYYER